MEERDDFLIKPHKYFNFDNSIIVVGAIILNILKNSHKVKYEVVLDRLIKKNGENSKYIFPQALSFLFLLGKVDYHQETDELEFII